MFPRWRDEIASGREQAAQLGERMTALVWKMIEVAAIGGLVVGLIVGGLFVWLIK